MVGTMNTFPNWLWRWMLTFFAVSSQHCNAQLLAGSERTPEIFIWYPKNIALFSVSVRNRTVLGSYMTLPEGWMSSPPLRALVIMWFLSLVYRYRRNGTQWLSLSFRWHRCNVQWGAKRLRKMGRSPALGDVTRRTGLCGKQRVRRWNTHGLPQTFSQIVVGGGEGSQNHQCLKVFYRNEVIL